MFTLHTFWTILLMAVMITCTNDWMPSGVWHSLGNSEPTWINTIVVPLVIMYSSTVGSWLTFWWSCSYNDKTFACHTGAPSAVSIRRQHNSAILVGGPIIDRVTYMIYCCPVFHYLSLGRHLHQYKSSQLKIALFNLGQQLIEPGLSLNCRNR